MKLLCDVNISVEVVRWLRTSGLEVARVPEIMDPRSPDATIVEEARQRGAVLVSQDQDFSTILATSGARGPSLINLRVSFFEAQRLAWAILAVIQMTEADLMEGAIVTLDDTGIRAHRHHRYLQRMDGKDYKPPAARHPRQARTSSACGALCTP